MKRLVAYFIACLVMLVTASGAFAEYVNPCAGDIARLCSNIPQGKGYIADCLSRNEAQLSPECKSLHLADLAEVLNQMHLACASDIVDFCGSEQMQPGSALLNCMWMWRASLSPDCRAKFTKALELMHY